MEGVEKILELLEEVKKLRPGPEKLAEVFRQRQRIESEIQSKLTSEVILYRSVWRELAEEIWGREGLRGKVDYDRAMLLSVSQIASSIVLLRLTQGIFKHAKIVVEGRSGIGKTTYAILATYGAYRILGLDEETAWRLASGLWIMDPVTFAQLMMHVVNENLYVPIIILDEAGLAFSKYWMWMGKHFRRAFSSLLEIFDLIKDYVGVMLLTSPSHENIAKRLRDICDYIVAGDEISWLVGEDVPVFKSFTVWVILRRTLYYYQTYSVPHRDIIKKAKLDFAVHTIDVTPGTLKLPSKLWKRHLRERKQYILSRLEEFIRLIEELRAELEEEVEDIVQKNKLLKPRV